MKDFLYPGPVYRSIPGKVGWPARLFPEAVFYSRFLYIVRKGGYLAKGGRYGDEEWREGSLAVLRALERVGVRFDISGLHHVKYLKTPCVFIGNHMSVLETVILPGLLNPFRKVTFIVKESLLAYPVFRHILRSRDPIAVGRTHPRKDLKTVLEGGMDRLRRGISIIVFPQTTRTPGFDPHRFSTMGVKLAQRADVPIIPMAVLTDAWGNGTLLKDFGKIDPDKPVCFAFGESIRVRGRGTSEHQEVIRFILGKLKHWRHRPRGMAVDREEEES